MALKSDYNATRSMNDLLRQEDVLNRKIINAFVRAGEQFVINAREQGQNHALGQYEDQTTNLRNSIGYFVFYEGSLVFENSKLLSNRSDISDMVGSKGFQLIGIAGMNYASYVESKGYNVISYQADICVVDLALNLEKLEAVERGTAAKLEGTFIP